MLQTTHLHALKDLVEHHKETRYKRDGVDCWFYCGVVVSKCVCVRMTLTQEQHASFACSNAKNRNHMGVVVV